MTACVQCRICKKKIEKDLSQKDKIWVNPTNRMYYHKTCYEQWIDNKNSFMTEHDADFWHQSLLIYLAEELKLDLNFGLFGQQWKSIIEGKFFSKNTNTIITPKGAYFAMKYFYEVSKADKEKGNGGIGIVAYIYEESCSYWINKEEKEQGICKKIEEQAKKMLAQKTIAKPQKKKQNKRPTYSLKDLEGWDE